jgi:hypothetical protein
MLHAQLTPALPGSCGDLQPHNVATFAVELNLAGSRAPAALHCPPFVAKCGKPAFVQKRRCCIQSAWLQVRLEALMWPEGRKPDITLIDQHDRFLFKPLMYELLTKKAPDFEVAPEFSSLLAPYSVRL